MNFSRILKLFVSAVAVISANALADAVSVDALSHAGATYRDFQLREIRDVLRGGRGGYIDLGFNYIPSPNQTPLETEYGEHDGFAFRHHLAGFGAGEISKGSYLGFLLWFDRFGWDGEDFLLFPHYNDFSAVHSVTTWGLVYTKPSLNLTFAGGMQHQNVEHVGNIYPEESDSLAYSWAHLRLWRASVQGNFYRKDWRSLRLSLDLESRAIHGGASSGPLTYLPNFEVALYNGGDRDDSVRVSWEQNLFAQRLYGEVSFDFPEKKFRSAALKYYPDPSRMIGFEASCIWRGERSGSEDLLWGGAVDLLFLRLAYNSAYEYERLFQAKGTLIVELKFSLATIDGFLFGRNAPKSAPMETEWLKKKNKDNWQNGDGKIQMNKDAGTSTTASSKTLNATGIRYEKSGSEGGK